MMLKKCLPVLAFFSLSAHAAELKTFSAITTAISQGAELSFVISLKSCLATMPNSDLTVTVKPNAVMLISNKRITASDKHFTLNDPALPNVPVIDYSKYNIDSDGSAELIMTVLDARDYNQISSHRVTCKLGEGLKVFSRE